MSWGFWIALLWTVILAYGVHGLVRVSREKRAAMKVIGAAVSPVSINEGLRQERDYLKTDRDRWEQRALDLNLEVLSLRKSLDAIRAVAMEYIPVGTMTELAIIAPELGVTDPLEETDSGRRSRYEAACSLGVSFDQLGEWRRRPGFPHCAEGYDLHAIREWMRSAERSLQPCT